MKGHYGTGDYTRPTSKEGKHYDSVRMQQGRVQLDSDWNEEVDIIDERWRATLDDVVGASGAPKVGGGFAIRAVTGQDLLLSPGHMYVDGILCRLDAEYVDAFVVNASTGVVAVAGMSAGETRFAYGGWIEISDPSGKVLLEAMVTNQVVPPTPPAVNVTLQLNASLPAITTPIRVRPIITYHTQPDLPSPPPIDMTITANQYYGKTYVAYLDVFQRHISALDDPAIREVALNGPDTGTRNRTTWQVRLLDVSGQGLSASCATAPFPPASTGRMQARAVPTSDPTQDCLLPAEAGYRRLENQLYRVEIHNPGSYQTATFKWSRDNGSVAVAWTDSADGQVTVKGAPVDSAEGFASGQWVELTDDVHELSPGDEVPVVLGTFVQLGVPAGDILLIDPTTAKGGSVAIADFPRNPKVRRWESPGAIPVKPVGENWIPLEDGIEVSFRLGGHFNKGDYWLIPARTATTDVEWPNDPPGVPVAQLPVGVEHRYCGLALIQVHSGGTLTVVDCRPQFPSLTAITAGDVSYDNASCQLINATTVQEALDALCRNQDLARHNKLIHGYGIVGGLQLECDRSKGPLYVKLRPGYAIDCNGMDVELKHDAEYDMGILMGPTPALVNGDGEYSLIVGLDQNGQVQVTAEPYKPAPSELSEIFGGTLLLDLFDDCVLPFQRFMKAELGKFRGDPPVTGAQELASAFVNLLAQGPNPQAGQNVYISAQEHPLLSTFYANFHDWLHSDTFCALFENVRKFPPEASSIPFRHSFGTGHHHRMKLRPSSSEIYTIGNGTDPTRIQPRINRYDGAGKLIGQIDPTSGAGTTGPIQDIAFSLDGTTIYVSLADASHANTIFRVGTVTAQGVNWTSTVTIQGVLLVKIEGHSSFGDWVMAIGMTSPGSATNPKVTGAYYFQPSTLQGPNVQLPLNSPFNACGHFELSGDYAWATLNTDSNAAPTSYNAVRFFQVLEAGKLQWHDITVPSGSDGIAIKENPRLEVYVVVGGGTAAKQVIGFYQGQSWTTWTRINDSKNVPMAVTVDNSQIRLVVSAWNPILMWASLDSYRVNAIDLATYHLVPNWALPTQVGPVDMVWGTQGLAILNQPSDSIFLVPQSLINTLPATVTETQKILNASVAYHKAAAEAYVDLLAGFLQYLKDCFCHHLLAKSAECTPASQKLYLGCVSIRGGRVHNICNFSQRHYLKTFPTIGYWLSLFPIVPIISELVELFCCYVIPDRLAQYSVPAYSKPFAGSTPQWTLQGLFATMQEIGQFDVRGKLALLLQQFGLARHAVAFSAGFRQLAPAPKPAPAGFVIGTSVISAQAALAQSGLVAKPAPFTPALGPELFNKLIDIFRPPSGPTGPVTLNQTAGQVVFTSNPPAQPELAALQLQVQEKDVQLQQMQTQLQAVTAQVQELHAFRQQVTSLLGGNQGPAGGAAPTQ